MSVKRDYYDILGVTKTSTQQEVKQQYRKLALKFHPDRNQYSNSEEQFKEISEAYSVISNPEKNQSTTSMAMPVSIKDILVKIFFAVQMEEDLIQTMYGGGVTEAVRYILKVNTMRQSNVMIKQ